jgi:hypothetical protein
MTQVTLYPGKAVVSGVIPIDNGALRPRFLAQGASRRLERARNGVDSRKARERDPVSSSGGKGIPSRNWGLSPGKAVAYNAAGAHFKFERPLSFAQQLGGSGGRFPKGCHLALQFCIGSLLDCPFALKPLQD